MLQRIIIPDVTVIHPIETSYKDDLVKKLDLDLLSKDMRERYGIV